MMFLALWLAICGVFVAAGAGAVGETHEGGVGWFLAVAILLVLWALAMAKAAGVAS